MMIVNTKSFIRILERFCDFFDEDIATDVQRIKTQKKYFSFRFLYIIYGNYCMTVITHSNKNHDSI